MLKLPQPATNEPGVSLLTAAYCAVPCFLVESGLMGCLQVMTRAKGLKISTVPGEFDEDVLAGWLRVSLVPLIYGGAHALASQPSSCCQQK